MDEFKKNKHCGRLLPLNFFDASSKVISIAGGVYVGKTYYLIVLLQLLKNNRYLQRFGISCTLIGDRAAIADLDNNWSAFDNSSPIKATIKDDGTHDKALIIDIMKTRDGKTEHAYLSFFDTPGEGYLDIEFMYKNFQCISQADALLLLMEPMQIQKLQEEVYRVTGGLQEVRQPHDLHEIFYNVIELLKNAQRNKKRLKIAQVNEPERREIPRENSANSMNIDDLPDFPGEAISSNNATESTIEEKQITKIRQVEVRPGLWYRLRNGANSKVKCPMAIGLTKIDQIERLLFSEIPHDNEDFESMYLKHNKLNEKAIQDISEEIKALIFDEEDGEMGVRNLLEAQVKNFEFFGIKSGDVDRNGIIINMDDPQGVLLPLLWLLTKIGFI